MSIDLQTIHLFGFEQSIRLAAEFEEALETLTANPFLGHERSDLSPAGRSFRYWVVQKRFVIVYEPHGERIHVARILDGARDLPSALAEDPISDG